MVLPVKGVEKRPEGANISFLLIHGFCAAPDEIGTLGDFLQKNGIASFAVQVAGHNTKPEDVAATTKDDWYSSVRDGLELIRTWNSRYIFVAGVSMGGVLALLLAARENDIDGVIPISPALKVRGFGIKLVPVLKYVMKYRNVDLSGMMNIYDIPRTKYEREPLSAIHELAKLIKVAKKEMPKVRCPALVIQSGEDKTIDPISGQIAFDSISSTEKQLHVISGAEHVIPCHPTRTKVYPLILEFVKSQTA
ncbi:MAG: alpha/beta hydrolase [Candidatus Hodarchaeota archaeon]